eukprot:GFUD01004620.1.p1 GENE.GFUD01004620.1~~GFUD01004620.1.p1  ORF type:complete len:507 (-),score=74.77 GFUD01004620.1:229-1749(-)
MFLRNYTSSKITEDTDYILKEYEQQYQEEIETAMGSGDISLPVGEETNYSSGTPASEMNYNTDIKVSIVATDSVAVIGTGNFGKAITTKLVQCGIQVVVGTRNPAGPFVSIEKALQEKIVILAVPTFSWPEMPLSKIQPGTALIDCSNRTSKCPPGQLSQAEQLQQLLPPGVHVVKGFNTISAYELENQTFSAGQQVPIAGNSPVTKNAVGVLLERLGYHFTDMGALDQARLIENIPLALFPNWKKPLLISVLIWIFLYFVTFGRYHFCDKNEYGWFPKDIKNGKMFTKYINKTCDTHALVLLGACYLPGIFAAYIQLVRGTKYSEFPGWLDNWLKMRKQLGIFMLLSASIHACFYVLLFFPHYSRVNIPTPSINSEDWDWANLMSVNGPAYALDLQGNIYLGAGVIAYFVAVILGVTSLPSVSASLSWKEFRMIQSWLGWFCLLLATTHVTANGWKKIITFHDCVFLGSEQWALILPALTILLKIPLLLPCVDSRLTQIRQGKVF